MGNRNVVSIFEMGLAKIIVVKVAVLVSGLCHQVSYAQECPTVRLGFHAVHPALAMRSELHIPR